MHLVLVFLVQALATVFVHLHEQAANKPTIQAGVYTDLVTPCPLHSSPRYPPQCGSSPFYTNTHVAWPDASLPRLNPAGHCCVALTTLPPVTFG